MIPYTMRYLFLILLFSSSLIFSNEKQSNKCADIEDNSSRLDCYDSLFRNQLTEDPELVKEPQEEKAIKEIVKVKESKEKEVERRFGLPLRSTKDKEKIQIKEKKFLNTRVITDLSVFKSSADLIITNRFCEELNDVKEKTFTRDLFGND